VSWQTSIIIVKGHLRLAVKGLCESRGCGDYVIKVQ
jgi:hypothetical protein